MFASAIATLSLLGSASAQTTMKELNRLTGGIWVSGNGIVVQTFQTKDNGKSLLGETKVKTPNEVLVLNARFGYDPSNGKVYYLDVHGTDTVYFGHVELKERKLIYEFKTLVGKPNKWLINMEFLSDDLYRTQMKKWDRDKWQIVSDWSEMKRQH